MGRGMTATYKCVASWNSTLTEPVREIEYYIRFLEMNFEFVNSPQKIFVVSIIEVFTALHYA